MLHCRSQQLQVPAILCKECHKGNLLQNAIRYCKTFGNETNKKEPLVCRAMLALQPLTITVVSQIELWKAVSVICNMLHLTVPGTWCPYRYRHQPRGIRLHNQLQGHLKTAFMLCFCCKEHLHSASNVKQRHAEQSELANQLVRLKQLLMQTQLVVLAPLWHLTRRC